MSNLLKRKNDDESSTATDQLTKRVALDSEQLELTEKQEETAHTAPHIQRQADLSLDETPSKYESDSRPSSLEPPVRANDNALPISKPVVGPRTDEETSTVSVRMLCPVKEAGIIVGKKGDTISHIREKANVRVYVSENLKNVPERVVSVKGSSENVARAFGLIARIILEEPEDEPASIMSKLYNLKLLVPHPMVGYIIGKSGSKFREIEENSAAKLKASEQPLPYSTDRVLSVTGVGDAIHIAIYYISQVMLEHRDVSKKHKIVLYNPANFRQQNPGNPMMNMHMPPQQNAMPYMGGNPMAMQGMDGGMKDNGYQQVAKPYDFLMMFQPSIRPQYNSPQTMAPPLIHMAGSQSLYTDEHGNTIVGDVITQMPTQVSTTPEKFTEDIFVANSNIGSVIGKGGNNIKQIRESSGCSYVKIEPDQNQSILLGGGKGLTNVRKLTLTGTYSSIQNAIFLINQRISADKERNGIQ
ncbi:CIC11C00000002196 [Sungouiella intermedia]|uniref:CIC11C00000002196 n=1 Tax=Sungouiella intermedia TaxID=45354 RepID=A0A1L0CZC1_9ASCO|nr:CIC11C00000002196 [[Candida] intermedia]